MEAKIGKKMDACATCENSENVSIFKDYFRSSAMTRLYRSETNKKLAGICGGIGEMKDVDPTIVRLMLVTIALITGVFPCIAAYLIAWWIIPTQREVASPTS